MSLPRIFVPSSGKATALILFTASFRRCQTCHFQRPVSGAIGTDDAAACRSMSGSDSGLDAPRHTNKNKVAVDFTPENGPSDQISSVRCRQQIASRRRPRPSANSIWDGKYGVNRGEEDDPMEIELSKPEIPVRIKHQSPRFGLGGRRICLERCTMPQWEHCTMGRRNSKAM